MLPFFPHLDGHRRVDHPGHVLEPQRGLRLCAEVLQPRAFAGSTVTLTFTGVEDSSLQTGFVVDDSAVTTG